MSSRDIHKTEMTIPAQILDQYDGVRFHQINEAQTRVDVIQRILYDVLQWKHSDVRIEERVSEDGRNAYADFVVRAATTAFVVEAKKIGSALKPLTSRSSAANSARRSI